MPQNDICTVLGVYNRRDPTFTAALIVMKIGSRFLLHHVVIIHVATVLIGVSQVLLRLGFFFRAIMWPDAVTAMSLPSSDLFTGLQFPQTLCNASYSFSADKKASCALGNINVTTTSTNTNLVLSPPADGMALTEIFVELQQSGSNFTTAVTSGGPLEVTGTYSIFIKLCVPTDAGARSDMRTVQLLTHGATLDNTYWDMAPGYSYVDAAAMAGYATLSYDRLGTGRSDHPDPLHVVQTPVEVDIIHELVGNLKAITFDGRGLENVVGVGHSLGSAISQGVTTKYPKDFDAVILTGAPANSTCLNAAFASFSYAPAVSDPSGRFSGLSTAYLTLGAIPQASQFAFWRYPHYDKKRT